MALTKEQWFLKLRSWVPSWVFEEEKTNVALFRGIARLLSEIDADKDTLIAQTFIDQATDYLDQHGSERDVLRLSGELNPPYRVRIKSNGIVFLGDKPDLAALINKILIRGIASIKEDWEGGTFIGQSYLNRGEVLVENTKDVFTIVVDRQVHEPFSFLGGYFVGDSYCGATESNPELFELIVETVNANKAFGSLYRVIERLN